MGEGYQTSATTWQETAQTGDAITHYSPFVTAGGSPLIMRWSAVTVVPGETSARSERGAALSAAGGTELGECRQSHGGNNDDFLFHVDFQQPAEMRFNRARVRRALSRLVSVICVMPVGW